VMHPLFLSFAWCSHPSFKKWSLIMSSSCCSTMFEWRQGLFSDWTFELNKKWWESLTRRRKIAFVQKQITHEASEKHSWGRIESILF
jgi:hypothetical protein